jgi:hypothetical protein
MRAGLLTILVTAVLLAACGGTDDGDPATPTPDCPTVVPASGASPTATPCVAAAVDATLTTVPATAAVDAEWEGEGDISSSVVYPAGSATCEDGWALAFSFTVDAQGEVTGEGTADLTSAPACTFPITAASLQQVEFRVLGRRDGAFNLRFALVSYEPANGVNWAGFVSVFGLASPADGGPPVSVSVSEGEGESQGSWEFQSGTPPATYSASGPISIRCTTGC